MSYECLNNPHKSLKLQIYIYLYRKLYILLPKRSTLALSIFINLKSLNSFKLFFPDTLAAPFLAQTAQMVPSLVQATFERMISILVEMF